ncbi:hypothetical protein G7Y89_g5212 [Cudoniella acicularis]|uniref:Major facilitator superfamily (MFS) profile domain-containing protein n=1 Tax=Cudoniella acicularis TaxID=354080 RepID=A0A8H4W3L0_9HELO|nr:hypothetical protein G7Y89_g5212 [Cudoniella acicularis]
MSSLKLDSLPDEPVEALSHDTSSLSNDGIPDGGFGWIQVVVAFTMNCFTWGQTAAYRLRFHRRLQFSLSMLVAPFVTILTRRLGTKPPMLLGICIQTGGFIFASFATQLWELYLSQGVLLGIGLGITYVPSAPILSQWFSKRRSLAVGISSAGSGVGGILFSFASKALISNISLAWAFRVTALIVGVMNLLSVLLLRDRNGAVKTKYVGFDTKLFFRCDVLLMLGWAFMSMLGYITLLYSLPDYANSLALSTGQAATISALLNLGIAVGRPIIGLMSDQLGRTEVAATATFLCGLICFAIWIPTNTYGVLIIFAVLSGALVGVFWMTIAPIATEIVGLAELPSLLSITWLVIVLPILFSEVIALELRRRAVPYNSAFSG